MHAPCLLFVPENGVYPCISHQLATNMGNSLIQHVGQYVQPSNTNHLWMRSMFRQTPMAPWPRPAGGLKDLLDIITLAMDIFQSWQQRLRCEIGPDFVVKGSTKNEQRIGKGIPILYCLISKKTFEIPYMSVQGWHGCPWTLQLGAGPFDSSVSKPKERWKIAANLRWRLVNVGHSKDSPLICEEQVDAKHERIDNDRWW